MEPSNPDGGSERSIEASTSTQQPSSSLQSVQSTDDLEDHHMCRVCRGDEGHLYYPCLCTGSIKYVHQECLTEWLRYSKKEVCELCNYKYSFQPIYRHDMPKALPLIEILKGVAISAASMVRTWLVYTMVLISWLGIVPLTAARIYHAVFYLSMQEILVLPISIFRTEQILPDVLKGCFLLIIFICTFISLVWLREQIIHGGPYDFLNIERDAGAQNGVEEQHQPTVEQHADGVANGEVHDQAEDMDDNADDEERRARPLAEDNHEQMTTNREVEGEPLRPEQADRAQPRAANEDRPAQEVPQPEDNWRDLDRLGDELTWQRLLGLDGSLVFLERVVWVISLDTLFTIVFGEF